MNAALPLESLPPAQRRSCAAACAHGLTLTLQAVVCARAGQPLFEPLDLQLPPGTLCWLRGDNGAGKTTLLRTLAGLGRPVAGQLLWNGTAPAELPCGRPHGIQYIGHADALHGDLRLHEAVAFLAQLHDLPAHAQAVRGAIEHFGLVALGRRWVRTLSRGQRRKAALARLALALDAPLWLLDEPYDALDQDGIAALDRLLQAHRQLGGSTLLTSHSALRLQPDRTATLQPLRHL